MRQLTSGALLLAAIALIPAQAEGQRRGTQPARRTGPKHEFGVDLGIAYYDQSGGGRSGLRIGTPLDLRVGIVPARGKMMFEPRVGLAWDTNGGIPDGSSIAFTPGVAVLYANGPGGHRRGMYFVGGAGLILIDAGAVSGTSFSIGGGVGWRKPYEGGALRYELGFRYDTKSDVMPSTINIGARLGLSLWH